jgi:putative ABC transport system permease protein
LRRPDGLVLDRSAARRYFGRDDAVGATLQLRTAADRALHAMVVMAVIEDLPAADTTFQSGIFAAGLAAFSPLALQDANPAGVVGVNAQGVSTFVRLNSAAASATDELQRALADVALRPDGAKSTFELVRIDRVNRHPGLAPGFVVKLAMMLVLGGTILLVAAVNFINLVTARSGQRALEVGIRKGAGATRGVLVLQFLGESLLQAMLGTVFAIALTEWSLPHVNSFLNSGAEFNYWRDPGLAAVLVVTPAVLAVLAGVWPALVLSSFRPGVATRAALSAAWRGNPVRQVLVTTQFALLIALMIAAAVVFQQRHFAMNQALRLNTDQMLMVWAPCRESFLNDLRAIPGVRGFACGGWQWLNDEPNRVTVRARDGSQQTLWRVAVDLAVFDLYGLKPVAGRLTLDAAGHYPADASHYALNETAARQLGFRSAQDAVGQAFDLPSVVQGGEGGHQIIAVVPDFSLASVENPIKPMAYMFEPSQQHLVSMKLAAEDIPATLAAIDRAWAATGAKSRTNRFFLDTRFEQMYLSLLRQAQAFGVIAMATVALAVFGLFGLAIAAVARRRREIGIRKALGAQRGDVVRLLLWQFARPVLWASLIACPLAGWIMQRWLDGFAYHIDMPLWLFPAVTALALLVAVLTVGVHVLRVAGAKPVLALRHE